MPLPAKLDDKRRLASRVVCGGKEHVGIEKHPHFSPVTASRISFPLPIIEPVVRVPLRDLFVTVVLDFEHDTGFEDNLAAAILENHDIPHP